MQKTVYFLEGHNERAIEGEEKSAKASYARAAQALRSENYRVEPLLLAAKGSVPEDADVVIIAGATRPLLGPEHDALRAYLERGGAVLLLVDPRAKEHALRFGEPGILPRRAHLGSEPNEPLQSLEEEARPAALFGELAEGGPCLLRAPNPLLGSREVEENVLFVQLVM